MAALVSMASIVCSANPNERAAARLGEDASYRGINPAERTLRLLSGTVAAIIRNGWSCLGYFTGRQSHVERKYQGMLPTVQRGQRKFKRQTVSAFAEWSFVEQWPQDSLGVNALQAMAANASSVQAH
jgi:hypothetical protein